MKNSSPKKSCKNNLHGYPSKATRQAYWMQALEPTSQEINDAFLGYHPQWVLQSQIEITGERFRGLREDVLKIDKQQCAAYLRVSARTISNWENGSVEVPFMAYQLLRMVYRSVQFKLSHPKWDGWFISDKGVLVSTNWGKCEFTPDRLEWISWQGTEASQLKREVNTLQAKLDAAVEENTKLRQMFVAQGVVDELAAMQDTIAELMTRIATARVIPFVAPATEQLKEKAA